MKLYYKDHVLTFLIDHDCDVNELLTNYKQSKKNRYFLYINKCIKVNEKVITQSIPLKKNDKVAITLLEEDITPLIPDPTPIDICYEDALFLVVNKPSHLLVHSDGINQDHTLCNRVQAYYDLKGYAINVRPIHRLDMDTTGMVVFCKLAFFQPLLDEMLQAKKIRREYDAFVQGMIKPEKQIINLPIAKDRHVNNKMRISKTGKPSKTEVTIVKRFKNFTWIHARLFSGRTHQIRVHLQAIHHPLLFDPIYGQKSKDHRLALHASKLVLFHPLLQKEIEIKCKLPHDMRDFIK